MLKSKENLLIIPQIFVLNDMPWFVVSIIDNHLFVVSLSFIPLEILFKSSVYCINIYWVFSNVEYDGGLFEFGGGGDREDFTTALLVEVSSLKLRKD